MQTVFYIVFIINFLLVGFLQFFGLSLTAFSYSIALIIFFVLFFFFLIKKKITINRYIITNLFLLLFIMTSGMINHSHLFLIINYTSFVIIPISIYLLVRNIMNRDRKLLHYMINILVIIQLPVLLLQYFFPAYIQYSKKTIIEIDRLFGTFPLAGDHFLSFFLIMNIIYLFVSKNKFNFLHYIIILCSVMNVFLMNSTISYFLLLFVLLYFLFKKANNLIVIPTIVLLFSLMFYFLNSYDIMTLLGKGSVDGIVEKANLFESGSAGRFQSIVYLLRNEILIFGNGPGLF